MPPAKRKASKATTRKSRESIFEDTDPVTNIAGAQVMLGGVCRDTIYRWMKNNPRFPRPFTYPGSNRLRWYVSELQAYRKAQPRRQYAVKEGAEA